MHQPIFIPLNLLLPLKVDRLSLFFFFQNFFFLWENYGWIFPCSSWKEKKQFAIVHSSQPRFSPSSSVLVGIFSPPCILHPLIATLVFYRKPPPPATGNPHHGYQDRVEVSPHSCGLREERPYVRALALHRIVLCNWALSFLVSGLGFGEPEAKGCRRAT